MTLYAVDDLDDALDATRRFLLPFDLGRWARLALVTFFVGLPGAGGFQFNLGGGAPRGVDEAVPPDVLREFVPGARLLALLAAVAAVVILLGLLFVLVGSVMEFVLVESLRREEVTIRRYWARRWRQGLRLFAFRLVFGALAFGSIAVLVAIAALPIVTDVAPFLSIVGFLFLLPAVFLLAVVAVLVNGFTTSFVVPIMLVEDSGVFAGWRHFWPTLRSQWKQYAVYAVLTFVLSIAAGMLLGIAVAALAALLLIPVVIISAIVLSTFVFASPIGVALFAIVGSAFVLALLAGLAFVGVPVVTYLRYFSLLVLGDTNDAYDLVPEQRAAVRGDGSR